MSGPGPSGRSGPRPTPAWRLLNSLSPVPRIASAAERNTSAAGPANQAGHPPEAAARKLQHIHVPPLLNPALCGTAGLATFLLLVSLQRFLGSLLHRAQRTASDSPLQGGPPEHFPAAISPPLAVAEPSSDVPAVEERRPIIAYHKALHTAALMSIEARALQPATSGPMLRRGSDYQGPRRRSTDNRPSTIYRGPFRRVTDPAADRAISSEARPQSEG